MQKPEPVDFRENKLALWRSPEAPPPIGAALENLGNTCFLNAVLQCVAHTVPLLQSLQSPPHPYPCAGDRGTFSGEEPSFCSLCALRQHIDVCMHEDANVVKPCGFVNNLSNISSSFSRYQQEDAHEFLHCLLDHLHTSCLDPPPGDSASLLQKTSLIKSTFGGRLKSQVQCCDCGHRSDTYEPLLDLSLEIEDAGSLEEALESFTKVEKIEDPEIKLTCEGCGGRVSVEKQFTLEQVPPVIALHLKRFKSNGYFADKIDKFVKYPTELDLRPFHSNPKAEGELRYDLYAAVMHQGCSSLYGHYYCFIRPSPDSWFIMDDEKVYRVNEENALTQNAYILFYMKRGTPWFSCFVEAGRMGGGGGCPDVGNRTSPVSVVDHVEADQSSSSSDSEDQGEASGADRPPQGAGLVAVLMMKPVARARVQATASEAIAAPPIVRARIACQRMRMKRKWTVTADAEYRRPARPGSRPRISSSMNHGVIISLSLSLSLSLSRLLFLSLSK
ncbi:unnamed protein product [Spirodela intermedia]|uniref:USP domain-containing protein n=1 Tax=Spirodela intermedia TaxID=51605 RepID=A0A7I8LMJ3_SPIIN|nr:unnamed protein product [Spirodela intermedia]